MKNTALKTAALLSGMVASSAFAQESGSPAGKSGATFWIDHTVLRWASDKTDPETGSNTETKSLQTTVNDVTVRLCWDNFGLRLQPLEDGAAVGFSMFPVKELEAGILLGTTRTENDNGGVDLESQHDSFGIFGTYYLELDARSTIEFEASYVYGRSEDEVLAAAGTKVKNESKVNAFEIGVQYDYEIVNHFHIVPGVFFNTGSEDKEVAGVESEDDETGLTINFAKFRYVF